MTTTCVSVENNVDFLIDWAKRDAITAPNSELLLQLVNALEQQRREFHEMTVQMREVNIARISEVLGADVRAMAHELMRAKKALKWYANPDIYKPRANEKDNRDLSSHARAVLETMS